MVYKFLLIVTGILFVLGFFLSEQLIPLFVKSLPDTIRIVSFTPTDLFTSYLMIGLILVFVAIIPFCIFWIFSYYKDALYESEKKIIFGLIPKVLVLFFVGAFFGWFVFYNISIPYFAGFNHSYGVDSLWSLSTIMEFLLLNLLGFGLAFQLPIIVRTLINNGFVSRERLKSERGKIIIGLLIISAFLTPPDFISQIVLALPLYLLYELSLI